MTHQTPSSLSGVIAATPTPLREDGSIDADRLIGHCHWLLGPGGCDAVNLLGTTGEAMSFSVAQRLAAMTAVAASGLPLDRMMVGTGAAALDDAVALTRAARDLGYAGALLAPPFYYKGIDDGALADWVTEVIRRAGGDGLRLYLYHIPQNTGVPYPADVVARLRDRHPGVVVGLTDSAGDLDYARALARRLPGFAVFPSSEGALAEAAAAGFAGCISATTNVTGALAREGWLAGGSDAGRRAIAEALAIREALARFPLVASVKWAVARRTRRARRCVRCRRTRRPRWPRALRCNRRAPDKTPNSRRPWRSRHAIYWPEAAVGRRRGGRSCWHRAKPRRGVEEPPRVCH
jgi:4-hydroxy-tetrahydrodipicolinate synthase